MSDSILECKNLVKNYGSKNVLKGINLSFKKGKIIGLLGPNGSGKTTFIKICVGLLKENGGEIYIDDKKIGIETKEVVSYLPERTYLERSMRVIDAIKFFKTFYSDFDEARALDMLKKLDINIYDKMKTMSKGTKEKIQLILVMSRNAKVYFLDEPIAGVDPAARDYIINTIINNYSENFTVVISTHLISDIENVLDEVIFIKNGEIILNNTVDEIREKNGKSVDALFREVFRC